MQKLLAARPFSQFSGIVSRINPQKITKWSILGLLPAASLLILPVGSNPIEQTSFILLLLTVVVLTVSWVLAMIQDQETHLSVTVSHFLLIGLGLSTVISLLFSGSHFITQLLGQGGVWLAIVSFVVLASQLLPQTKSNVLALVITTTGSITALLLLLQLLGIPIHNFYNAVLAQSFFQATSFSPTGSAFVAGQVSFLGLLVGLSQLSTKKSSLPLFLAVVCGLGLAISVWLSLPGKPSSPVILPWSAGWSVAIDTLKQPKTALIGVGPDNFIDAYTQHKPGWMNLTNWWNVQFTQSSSLPLTLLATQGLVGFGIWTALSASILAMTKKAFRLDPALTTAVVASTALLWVVPITTIILLFWAVSLSFFLAQVAPTIAKHYTFQNQHPSFGIIISVAKIIGSLGLLYLIVRLISAEYAHFVANRFTLRGNIVEVYEQQKIAISANPYDENARRQYALTNLAIASALTNKADLSEQDVQRVAILVQQTIREGQVSTLLSPDRAQNWEIVGDIYTNFIGSLEGADNLAAEAYRVAISKAPNNPTLYIKLGGVFYRQARFSDAIVAFEEAARVKPDLANAYYNAANAFKELGNFQAAENSYQQTLIILERTSGVVSEEYIAATSELEQLQSQLNAAEATETTPE